MVTYLADIINSLNSLSISVQCTEDNIFCFEDKVEVFLKKTWILEKAFTSKIYNHSLNFTTFVEISGEVN